MVEIVQGQWFWNSEVCFQSIQKNLFKFYLINFNPRTMLPESFRTHGKHIAVVCASRFVSRTNDGWQHIIIHSAIQGPNPRSETSCLRLPCSGTNMPQSMFAPVQFTLHQCRQFGPAEQPSLGAPIRPHPNPWPRGHNSGCCSLLELAPAKQLAPIQAAL